MSKLIFRQLFDRISCTYTYLLGDSTSSLALLIDPVYELVERDLSLVTELGLNLKYVLNTHVHADHISGSGEIKKRIQQMQLHHPNLVVPSSVISKSSGAKADVHVSEGDEITIGPNVTLRVLSTPGHTNGCVTYVDDKNYSSFTGDALLIRGCGRTDFQEGDSKLLYDSVHQKIFKLPTHFKLFPAHDYKGLTVTTVEEEKKFNPRLSKSKDEFVNIMANLNLDYPKMIDKAVPANLACGIQDC